MSFRFFFTHSYRGLLTTLESYENLMSQGYNIWLTYINKILTII